jgi:dTDP-4-amino-4,6-dideoxygalactose transaminase
VSTEPPPSAAATFVTQGEVPWWRTHVGQREIDAMAEAARAERFSHGKVCAEMEAEIGRALGVPHVYVTPSCTMAMTLALMAHGVGPGDEVIVPARTFIATAHAAMTLGAKVVLVDCRAEDTVVDVDQVAARINRRTKAIMPVHLNGRAADMDRLIEIGSERGVAIVEDAAQAIFSRDRRGRALGTIGTAGCFSFGMAKLVSTGQGGALATRDDGFAKKVEIARNHGVIDLATHEYLGLGGNFKFTDTLASLGLWQLRRAAEKIERVTAIYRRYAEGLSDLPYLKVLPIDIEGGEIPVWTEVVTEERDAIMAYLSENGVQSRRFLPCLHTAPHLRTADRFPHSERFDRQGFNLPGGPALDPAHVDRTIEVLRHYGRSNWRR